MPFRPTRRSPHGSIRCISLDGANRTRSAILSSPLAKQLPLRKASPFADREMIRLVLASSGGITARATRLITRAAAEAVADGTECIDCARIDAMNARKLSDAARPRH